MLYFIFKALLTGVIVAAVSEIARKSSILAAVLISLPLSSILALIWLYVDTANAQETVALSKSIFWMILPSLLFFFVFPFLVKRGFSFYPALITSSVVMICAYFAFVQIIKRLGIVL